ncbi:phage head spike fiber domain-containing protein [Comamonas testosteroni]|uniref:phage head spike fiber domain-containing protein n=1 Tax=Comamonas testosteroni TaxID=285 RepID=UPI0015F7FF2E|nr:hypothetical protein [Comamonas testosteroni]
MATILNMPELRPAVLLDFANSGQVDPRISFTRASAATRWNAAGVRETVPAGVPRIDYDPATGKCLGLLVEGDRTNLVRRSNEFSHADWVQSALVGIGAPDANLMTKLVATTENRTHELYSATSSIGFADETLLTISVEAKADGANFFWLRCVNKAGSFPSATFNLLTGAASLRGAISASMRSLGGGVYRCSATFNLGAGASGSAGRTVLALASGEGAGAEVFAGDGVSGVWFRNVQTEVGAFASSYIPTVSAAATRAADSVTLQLSSPVSAGALVVAATPNGWSGADARFVSLTDGTTANCVALHLSPNGNGSIASVVTAAGNFQYGPAESAILPLRRLSRALTWGQASARVATNGVLAAPSGAITLPAPMNRLDIGNRLNTQFFSGHIERCALYAARITDSQLQRITA